MIEKIKNYKIKDRDFLIFLLSVIIGMLLYMISHS